MANTPTPKPSTNEDEYFLRENAEKLRRLTLERAKALQQAQREQLAALHHMHCPKCGMELQPIEFRGVRIDKCFNCGATVFDADELEKLEIPDTHPGAVMRSILNIFR